MAKYRRIHIGIQELTPVDVDSPPRGRSPMPSQPRKSAKLSRTPSSKHSSSRSGRDGGSDEEITSDVWSVVGSNVDETFVTQIPQKLTAIDQQVIDNETAIQKIRDSLKTSVKDWAHEFVYGDVGDESNGKNETNVNDSECYESDTGYDTDMDTESVLGETFRPKSVDPQSAYIEQCDNLGILPVSYFLRNQRERDLIMKNHGLGPLGAKAIAIPLEKNTNIERLNLEGNDIQGEGAEHLCKMLKENLYITDLHLPENGLGSHGARQIFEMLTDNHVITKLDLSGNEIHDWDGVHLCAMLENNTTLKYLYIRNNYLSEQTSFGLKEVLANNESLELLDISWNHIRMKGAEAIGDGIAENIGLKYLNLSMNGFGVEGATAMGKALAANRSLKELDISWNRIPYDGGEALSKGLTINDILRVLRIGNNPLTSPGAFAILHAIGANDCSQIEYLDMMEIFVNQRFLDLKISIEKERTMQIIHGDLQPDYNNMAHIVQYDFESAFDRDPMTVLKRYAESNGLRIIDLFRQFDKDNSLTVNKEEFVLGVRSAGIDLSNQQIDRLIKKLDKDGDGEIDYAELLDGDKQNRQAKRMIQAVQVDNQRKVEVAASTPLLEMVVVKKHTSELNDFVENESLSIPPLKK